MSKLVKNVATGIPVLIVEHDIDRVFALERGAVFHQGPAAPLLTDLEYLKQILWL